MSTKITPGHAGDDVPAALRFMFAARRCELDNLVSLAGTCKLTSLISWFVHALQKERGYANLYLSGSSADLLDKLNALSADAEAAEAQLRDCLRSLDTSVPQPTDRARMFHRIAWVLYSLESLPGLRRRIRDRRLAPQESTAAFTRLIGGLMAVVFEAADTAFEPQVARALVALFNFMQGKELCGQERACGVQGLIHGFLTETEKEQIRSLAQSQERSFDIFVRYAASEALARWAHGAPHEAAIRQLRDVVLRTSCGQPVDAAFAEVWFELHTVRIDAMHEVESLLSQALLRQGEQRLSEARAELNNHRVLLRQLADSEAGDRLPVLFSVQGVMLDAAPKDGVGSHLGRSILDMMQEQTRRLEHLAHELEEARSTLSEHKTIEQAKRLLIRQCGLSEQIAHERIQRAAMDRGEPVVEIARQLIAQFSEGTKP